MQNERRLQPILENDHHFRLLAETASDAIIIVDVTSTILFVNPAVTQVFGYRREELLGASLSLLMPEYLRHVHEAGMGRYLSTGERHIDWSSIPLPGLHKDGYEIALEVSFGESNSGGTHTFTGIIRDVTARRRLEAQREAQYTLTQILAEAPDLKQATPKLLQAICSSTGWKLGMLWFLDLSDERLHLADLYSEEPALTEGFEQVSQVISLAVGEGLPGRVFSDAQPVWIRDVTGDSNFPRGQAASAVGLRSAVAFPIRSGRRVLGVLEFFSREIREPDIDLLKMMDTFGNQIGGFIERKQAEVALQHAFAELEARVEARTAELREREQQFRDLFESSPDAIFVEDRQGYVLDVNPAACELHGLTRDELVGRHVSALVPPEDHERVMQEFVGFTPGQSTRYESVSWVEGRGRVPVEIRTRSIDYRNQPALLLHVRDISERRQIDQARQEELALTQAVLENITDAVVACSAEGRLTVFNRAARELHGLQEQPLEADVWAETYNLYRADGTLMRPEEIPLYRAWKGERVTNIPMRIISRSGETHSILASGQPIRHATGQVLGAVVAMRDVTEQEQAREMAESAHHQLVDAIETLSDGFALYDNQDRLVICNTVYRDLYALTGAVIEGRTFEEMLRQGVARGQYQEATGREEDFIHDRLERHRNPPGVPIEQELGDGRWLRILERRTRDGGIVGIRTDITELKRREADLRELNRELEAFSYSVSHDLRAPLRTISGFSHALLEDYGDHLESDAKEYLDRIQAATQRMGELIDDLLKLSHLSRQPVNPKRVDLSQVAREISQQFSEREPERRVEVIIEDELVAHGDERLLRIMLENLFTNAWKFTRNQPQARITFGSAASGHEEVFFVRDNGAGFDMRYAASLFVPFQRLHKETEYEGTGIGLATVQRIIHRHRGRIWAEGTVGQGATFYFTLSEGQKNS